MKMLLVASSPDIDHTRELLAALSGGRVETLTPPVSAREVLSLVASGDFNTLHFAGHGDASAFDLTDGLLPVDLLANALAKNCQINLVVLNACHSLAAAVDLYNLTAAPRVIGWPGPVSDAAAGRWAETFYRAYRLSQDCGAALRTAGEMLERCYPDLEGPKLLNGRVMHLQGDISELRQEYTRTLHGRALLPWWALGLLIGANGLSLALALVAVLRL